MADRQATVVCTFEPTSPRITAYDIHEWIYEELRIPEDQLRVIQIDVTKKTGISYTHRRQQCTDLTD
jgi:hypothetical protein